MAPRREKRTWSQSPSRIAGGEEAREFWPKFTAHHNEVKWHDNDFASMRTMLRLDRVCVVIDFAENHSRESRFKNQCKYFSQVGSVAAHPTTARAETFTLSLPFDELSIAHRCSRPSCLWFSWCESRTDAL